jgi:hypothetical protein
MAVDQDEQSILDQIGDPADVARELKAFSRSARSLDKHFPDLVDRYPEQWVAVFSGKVRAHGPTFSEVMKKIDQEGLPRDRTIVRFIDKGERAMIL